jgi:hypothetical protein
VFAVKELRDLMPRLLGSRIAPVSAALGDLLVGIIKVIYVLIQAFPVSRLSLAAENLALQHLSLDRYSPTPRYIEPSSKGEVIAIPPRFNSASTLKVEVQPGDNTADFQVTSK